jgi:hypothetical protein
LASIGVNSSAKPRPFALTNSKLPGAGDASPERSENQNADQSFIDLCGLDALIRCLTCINATCGIASMIEFSALLALIFRTNAFPEPIPATAS